MSLKRLTVRAKLYILASVCAVTLICYVLWSLNSLSIAKVNGPYYKRIVQDKELVADILPPPNYIIESYLLTLHIANEVEEGADESIIRSNISRVKELESEFTKRHEYWDSQLAPGRLKELKTVACYQPANEFFQILNNEFFPACLDGDAAKAKRLARGTLRENYEQHRDAVDKVVTLASERSESDEATIAAIIQSRTAWSIAVVILLLGFIAGFTWYVANETVAPLRRSADQLHQLSTKDLTEVSHRLRTNAESTSDQATMASGAAEQVSANAQSLATAVEQFELSIKEIAANASNAASVARNAVEATQQTNQTVTRLGDSSTEIGNVIKVINSIAEQTNLLALNATIEAARAGEAGKGFAVVANEVKELAKETSKATEDIIRRIETIQNDTHEAIDAIGLVSDIIAQINETQNAIAGAVEEQTTMTSEISRNISEVATGSGEIAQSISLVADAARNTTDESDETLATAASIEALADDLMKLVGKAVDEGSKQHLQSRETLSVSNEKAGKYRISAPKEITFPN